MNFNTIKQQIEMIIMKNRWLYSLLLLSIIYLVLFYFNFTAYIGDYFEEEKYGFCMHCNGSVICGTCKCARTVLHWIVKWWRLSLLHTLCSNANISHILPQNFVVENRTVSYTCQFHSFSCGRLVLHSTYPPTSPHWSLVSFFLPVNQGSLLWEFLFLISMTFSLPDSPPFVSYQRHKCGAAYFVF